MLTSISPLNHRAPVGEKCGPNGHANTRRLLAITVSLFAGAAGQTQKPSGLTFTGSCDGSGVAMIDTGRIVTISDEENILRIYPLAGGRDDPGRRLDIGRSLGILKEGDFEAGARIGNIIYWIGSFGANVDGQAEASRRRLLAVTVSPGGSLAFAGAAPATLFDVVVKDVLAPFGFATAGSLPPKAKGGLNIEGLAPTPDGDLLLGFRNPLVTPASGQPKAIVARLSAPHALMRLNDTDAARPVGRRTPSPRIRSVELLDLGGRGIRDIAFRAKQSDYFILAGAINGARNFALYRWGGGRSRPVRIKAAFGDLMPEGMSVLPDGRLLVLSDDDSRAAGLGRCKDLPANRGSFRGEILTIAD
jgi:hypothetical protein